MTQQLVGCQNMKKFNYSGSIWNNYILNLLSDALSKARETDTTQYIYVFRQADAEQIMDMLHIIELVSRAAYLVEVKYVGLN